MFQVLRQGGQVYLLHTSQADLHVEVGTIETTNAPMMAMYPIMNYPLEITVRVGGKVVQYKGINASAESAVAREQTTGEDAIIACSREAMNCEIDKLKQEAVNHINMTDFYRTRIVSCDNVRMQLNPEEAQKAQQQAEMQSLKDELAEMRRQMLEQASVNKQLLEQLRNSETSSLKNNKE